jgi:hypothetical protein
MINTDVKLDPKIFRKICEKLQFTPELDAFANKKHHQLENYCTLDKTDKDAYAQNAFSISWKHKKLYCNPPFYYTGKLLRKL